MARLPQPGSDNGTWGAILNDYLLQSHDAEGFLKSNTVGVAQLKNDSVTSAAIADGSVTESHLDATLRAKVNADTPNADQIDDSTTANKFMTVTEKSKLAGIATGATANDTDANLKNRANHTGTQAISTIDGLQNALDAKALDAEVVHRTGDETITGRKSFAGGISFTSNGYTSTVNVSLSQDRVLNWPNNSGSLMTQSSADALANKSISGANNTITNIDLGSIPMMGTNGVLSVNHGSSPDTARPVGAAMVIWTGTVQPANMTTADLWVEIA